MFFRMLYDDKLAQASYLLGCQRTGEALVIDPQRDVERYLILAAEQRMQITAITETHIHADFLSGARELAERTGACLYLSDEGTADWKYLWLNQKQGGGVYKHRLLKNQDTFNIGHIQIKAVYTPGHTPEHLSFLVTDLGAGATEPMGIASGDFVFVGDVGRPDLLETAAGYVGDKEKSAKTLYESLQLFKELPDYLQLWPGHGSGSACGKALGAVPQSTVGYEKRFNAAVADASNEARFVESILYGQPEPPLYFARMKKENKEGPALLGELPTPTRLTPEEFQAILSESIALIDTRSWPEFVRGHAPGALFAPLTSAFPTVVGSYVLPGAPIYLIVDETRVTEAVTDLIRIGLDQVTGYLTPETLLKYAKHGGEMEPVKSVSITELPKLRTDGALILDVRRADEYDAGHLPHAKNIAHTRLLDRLDEIPKDREILVHCRTSGRSAYASALLAKHGFNITHLSGGFIHWHESGGDVVEKLCQG
ncbi:MAG: rhodanese-like domain-containing protein [bacterium]